MVSSLGVLGVAISGCSSGFQRFDRSIYEEGVPQQASQNPYPGDLDTTTTASAGRKLVPLRDVNAQALPDASYHNPEPTFTQRQPAPQPVRQQTVYQQPQYQQPVPAYQQPASVNQQPVYQPPAPQPLASYIPPQTDYQAARTPQRIESNTIASAPLPKATPYANTVSITSKPLDYSPPKPDGDTVFIPPRNADATQTASVGSQPAREAGWTSTGGTTITIREGETLYNLSKRYGVPVNAIRDANGFSATDGLKTGQRVVIPNYVFSQSAGISAPDNNPNTRAASAGTGYLGEAKSTNVTVPTKRPEYFAAVSPSGETLDFQQRRYQPTGHVSPPEEQKVPNYGIVVGQANPGAGQYVVQPGDSLSAIAARNGTTVAALQHHNGMTGTGIKIGQKLTLPGTYDSTTTASVPTVPLELPPGVDPIITGSVNSSNAGSEAGEIDTSTPAPARSGISQFRWPVKGRIVNEFGSQTSNGQNEGIDISVPEGTAVRAAENGVVIYTGSEISTYGNLILVRHDDDWVSAYAHNRDFEVKKGDRVRRGQIIARSGKTGDAERPKLHFELRKDSQAVDPTRYLSGA